MSARAPRQPLPHEHPTLPPPQLDPELAIWLAEKAHYLTSTSAVDFCTCNGCGHPISFGETLAVPQLPQPGAERICWSCLIGILFYRGVICPADTTWPSQYFNGTWHPDYTILDACLAGDRRPYGPTQAQLEANKP